MRHHRGNSGQHRGNVRIARKDVIRAALFIGIILALAAVIFFLITKWEKFRYTASDLPPASVIVDPIIKEPKIVELDGIRYQQKRNTESYLFLGIDQEGTATGIDSYVGGGQADVQMLLVLDHEAKTWQMLQLNRDSIVDVPVLGVTGKVIGTKQQQLALAHAYGKGLEDSCQNTVNAVSNLLWNQPIQGYLSVHMDAIPIINDAVGGVEVQITSDFSAVDPTLVPGQTLTLNGQQALTFIRSRKDVDDETNLSRMGRHRQYLDGLFRRFSSQSEESVLRIYQDVNPYLVTDMGSGTISKVSQTLKEYTQLPMLTIAGSSEVRNENIAYILDEASLQQTVLDLFYVRLK